MRSRFEMRTSPTLDAQLERVRRHYKLSNAAVVRMLLRREDERLRGNASPGKLAAKSAPEHQVIAPGSGEAMYRWLGLGEPSDEQLGFFRRFPKKSRGFFCGSLELQGAAWCVALSHPLSVVIFTPTDAGLDWVRERWKLTAERLACLKERDIQRSSKVQGPPPRAWVTCGMPEEGNYPNWFREGLGRG